MLRQRGKTYTTFNRHVGSTDRATQREDEGTVVLTFVRTGHDEVDRSTPELFGCNDVDTKDSLVIRRQRSGNEVHLGGRPPHTVAAGVPLK